jgi:hypothetical protein
MRRRSAAELAAHPKNQVQIGALVLGELEVGLARCCREGAGNRAAAVQFPEGETERDRVGEPGGAAAEQELASGDVDR